MKSSKTKTKQSSANGSANESGFTNRSSVRYSDDAIHPPQSNCFTFDELKDFSLGRTNEFIALKIERHMADCGVCEDTFVSLENVEDTFVQEVKQVSEKASSEIDGAGSDSSMDNGELIEALSHAKQMMNLSDKSDALNGSENGPFANPDWHRRIGDYELCELIGRGGMGQVFRARHRRLEKEFALKVLSGRRMQSREAVSRFQREMKIVGQLDHPSIVQATDAGQSGEVHYLTMEYVSGLNLSRVLHFEDPLAIDNACEMVRQAAEGIEYAHQTNVIHRDIKPSNLMLDSKGQVKILDLGLATLNSMNHSVDELTTVGQMMGTLDYMAPEQCEDNGVDHRCDIYSLGATLYKLLTGRAPYSGEHRNSPLQKLRAIAIDPIAPIKTFREEIPKPLAEIVEKCLERQPQSRYQSAQELAMALKPFCERHDLAQLLKDAQLNQKRELVHEKENRSFEGVAIRETPSDQELQIGTRKTELTPSAESDRGQQSFSSRSRFGWLIALATLAFLPLAWWSIQIIINWENGQLVIESDNPNVQVRLIKDGKPYKEMSIQQGANSTKVRAGRYEILIEDPSDQMVVANGSFVLKRGETTVATITSRDKAEATDSPINKPTAAGGEASVDKAAVDNAMLLSTDQPTYQGKTLAQWFEDPQYPKILLAADSLRRAASDEMLRAWIDKTIANSEREVSISELYQRVKVMGRLCPDDKSAKKIVELVINVFKRYDANEILSTKIQANVSRSAGGTQPLRSIPFEHSLSDLIAGRRVLYDRVAECLASDNSSEVAFGTKWCLAYGIPKGQESKFFERVSKNFENSTGILKQKSFDVIEKRYQNDPSSRQWLANQLSKVDKPIRYRIYKILSRGAPKMMGFASMLVGELRSEKSRNFLQLGYNIASVIAGRNSQIIDELDRLFQDSKWGWDKIDSSSQKMDLGMGGGGMAAPSAGGGAGAGVGGELDRKEFVDNPKNWYGLVGTGVFPDTDAEIDATVLARRVQLIEMLAQSFTGNGQGVSLLPILKRELDTKYNDHYLGIVLSAIKRIDENEANVFGDFWINIWMTAGNDEIKNRALKILKKSGNVKKSGNQTRLNSSFAELVVNAMRKVNCVSPDEKELQLIREACDTITSGIHSSNEGFWKSQIAECTEVDLPFLLWYHYFGLGGKMHALSPQQSGKLMECAKKQGDFLVMARSTLVGSRRARTRGLDYRELRDLSSLDLTDEQRLVVISLLNSRRVSLGTSIELFTQGDERCLAAALENVRSAERRVEEPPRRTTDWSGQSSRLAHLIELFIDPRPELMKSSSLYAVSLWEGPLLSDQGGKVSNAIQLIEMLRNERFIESDFKGKKDEIIANLKKVELATKDNDQKEMIGFVLNRISKSQTVATFLRATSLAQGAQSYKKSMGVFPDEIRNMVAKPDGVDRRTWGGPHIRQLVSQQDAWGNEFQIKKSEIKNSFSVISAGPDLKFGTDDDVTSDDTEFRYLFQR